MASNSVPGSNTSRPLFKAVPLRLLGHCIFCLRKVHVNPNPLNTSKSTTIKVEDYQDEASDANDSLELVPKAIVPPDFLPTFNLIWPLMQKRKTPGVTGSSPGSALSWEEIITGNRNIGQESTSGSSAPSSAIRTFGRLPTLCQFCADKMLALQTLMEAIKWQVGVLREVITESKKGGKFSWRMEQFEKQLRDWVSTVGEDEIAITSTLGLLDGLGDFPAAPPVKENTFNKNSQREVGPTIVSLSSLASERGFKGVNIKRNNNDGSITIIKSNSGEPSRRNEANASKASSSCSQNSTTTLHNCKQMYPDSEAKEPKTEDPSGSDYDANDIAEELNSEAENKTDTDTDTSDSLEEESDDETEDELNVKTEESSLPEETPSEHNEPEPEPFPCSVEGCLAVYYSSRSLGYHQRRDHPEIYDHREKFHCVCGKSFMGGKNFRNHQRNCFQTDRTKLIKGIQKQRCDLCGNLIHLTEIFNHLKNHVGGDYVLKCSQLSCRYHFSNSLTLQRHLDAYHFKNFNNKQNKINLACDHCPFKTSYRFALRGHVFRVHERGQHKPFQCPISNCSKKFCVRQSVDIHLSTHTVRPIRVQKCDQCSESLKVDAISAHLRDHHQVSEILSCPHCPCMYSFRTELVTHLYRHRSEGMLCDICRGDTRYSRQADLRHHYLHVHQVECQAHTCQFCSKSFSSKVALMSHEKRTCHQNPQSASHFTVPVPLKSFPCDVCLEPQSFSAESVLIAHQIRVHGADPFTCSLCYKQFYYSTKLSRHMKVVHAGMQLNQFPCQVAGCEKVLTTKKSRKIHMASFHGGEKNHVCDLCGKSFTMASQLRTHHDLEHLGLRSFVCDICGETFKHGRTLKIHKLIHTGERPYNCSVCGQRFRQKMVLARHEQAHKDKGAEFKPNGPMKKIRKRKWQTSNLLLPT